jgi:hypothetical protein
MPALTAIELGPDTCVLVRGSLRGAALRVAGVEILDPAAFPGSDAFTATLKQLRRKMKFARRARVVLWGLPDGATPHDPAVRSLLAPLESAGFRVQRVVSPCNALAALARIRTPRPDGAMGWLAVDRAGVAIVVARPGELLYSHTFGWDSSIGATGSQARMLQRYSLVASLAPELRRAIAAASDKGGRVDTIITCGNLPDLRSLTMPLIEELDLEVETLDSLDGLTVNPEVRGRLTDLAPAIRIACAGAATRPTRPLMASTEGRNRSRMLRAAALLVTVGGIGWWWYSQRTHRDSKIGVMAGQKAPTASAPSRLRPSPPSPSVPKVDPPAGSQTILVSGVAPGVRPQTPAVSPRVGSDPTPPGSDPGVRPFTPSGVRPQSASLLNDPLPQISTILASPERRFAMIDGRVVSVGDRLGQRLVTAIEPRTVVFREPSGVHISVGLGGRLLGVIPR